MSNTQEGATEKTEAGEIHDKNKEREVDTRQEAHNHVKFQDWISAFYDASIKALLVIFGSVFLWQIAKGDTDLVTLVENLFGIAMEHGKVGYLALAAVIFFFAKGLFVFIRQSPSGKT